MNKLILDAAINQEEYTGLRAQGKIYVVILVVAIIFIGLSLFLISLDRRLKRLENKEV